MKKLVSVLFLVFVMVIVSACGKEEADKKKAEPAKSEQEEKGVEVEKGLRNVEVTLPASLIGEKDTDELIKEAKAKGVKEVTKNDDGSITYKMSKQEHEKMMQEMEKSVQEYIEETKNDENVSSIKTLPTISRLLSSLLVWIRRNTKRALTVLRLWDSACPDCTTKYFLESLRRRPK